MDHTDGGGTSSHPQNSYRVNSLRGYGSSSQKSKLPSQDSTYTKPSENNYSDQEEEDEDPGEEEEEVEDTDVNGILVVGNDDHDNEGGNDNDDENEDNFDDDDDDDENEEARGGSSDAHRHHQKKQKLKTILANYELVPRIPPPTSTTNNVPRSLLAKSTGGRNPLTDWTEHETSVLLDAWGECFLRHGRKSLRSDEWHEVAEKVSQQSRVERTDSQCRNRLDTLKKRYKKEKTMVVETRGGGAVSSNWVFFKKMDMLMSSPSQQPAGLSCGMDSGEYVFMNPKVYLNRANGLDEMRDSPGNSLSSSQELEGVGSDELPPRIRKGMIKKKKIRAGGTFQLLADSVQKFNAIYEEVESKARQQMIELGKMRLDFHREIEMQRRQILERAQAEIMKIREGRDDNDVGDNDENDASDENVSG